MNTGQRFGFSRIDSLLFGMVAKYSFNETSGNLIDSVGQQNGIVPNNGVGITRGLPGVVGECYSFDSNYHEGIETSFFGFESNSITVSMWVNYENDASRMVFIDKRGSNSDNPLSIVKEFSSVKFYFQFLGESLPITIEIPVKYSEWVNYSATVDNASKKIKIYENFNLKTTYDFSGLDYLDNNKYLAFAKRADNNAQRLKGKMDQTILWNRALKEQEIYLIPTIS